MAKWISGAIKHPGALTADAKRAGQSMDTFCARTDLSPTDVKRCSLRKTLMSFHKK